jgi:hypothetical protein
MFLPVICDLFDTIIYTPSNGGVIVYNELERMWKEAVMA